MKKFLMLMISAFFILFSCTDVSKSKSNSFVLVSLPGALSKAAYTVSDVEHYKAELFLNETLTTSHIGKPGSVIACEALVPGVYIVRLNAYNSAEENENTLIAGGSSQALVTAGEMTSVEIVLVPRQKPEIIEPESPAVDGVEVTSVTIARSGEGPVYEGSSITLVATVLPENATDKSLTWTSSDTNFATVENGVVTAKKVGHAVIAAKSVNGVTATYELVIEALPASKAVVTYSTDYGIMPDSITVDAGATLTEENLPTLEENGYKFTGWYIGETKVEPGYKVENSLTLTAKWSEIEVASVSLTAEKTSLLVGETASLTAVVLPENAKNKTLTWTSSDEEIATVENGVVTAKKLGDVTITATSSNGKTAAVDITVSNEFRFDFGIIPEFNIRIFDGVKNVAETENSVATLVLQDKDLEISLATVNPEVNLDADSYTWFLNGKSLGNDASVSLNVAKSYAINVSGINTLECVVEKAGVRKTASVKFNVANLTGMYLLTEPQNGGVGFENYYFSYAVSNTISEVKKANYEILKASVVSYIDSYRFMAFDNKYNECGKLYCYNTLTRQKECLADGSIAFDGYTFAAEYSAEGMAFDKATGYLYIMLRDENNLLSFAAVDTKKPAAAGSLNCVSANYTLNRYSGISAMAACNGNIYIATSMFDANGGYTSTSPILKFKTMVQNNELNPDLLDVKNPDAGNNQFIPIAVAGSITDFIEIDDDPDVDSDTDTHARVTDFYSTPEGEYLYFLVRIMPVAAGYSGSFDYSARGALGRIKLATDEFDTSFATNGLFGWGSEKQSTGSYTSYYGEVNVNMYWPSDSSTGAFTGFYGPMKIIAIKEDELVIQDEGAIIVDLENKKLKDKHRLVTVNLSSVTASFTDLEWRAVTIPASTGWNY